MFRRVKFVLRKKSLIRLSHSLRPFYNYTEKNILTEKTEIKTEIYRYFENRSFKIF